MLIVPSPGHFLLFTFIVKLTHVQFLDWLIVRFTYDWLIVRHIYNWFIMKFAYE